MYASDDEDSGAIGPATCDEYTIERTLGQGKTSKVKLATNWDGEKVAIKRFKEQMLSNKEQIMKELHYMSQMDHENILKLLSVRQKACWTTSLGKKYEQGKHYRYECFCIVIEYVGGGDLFELVAQSGYFQEPLARLYFHQLIEAVTHMHKKGVCHRDLKPQNLLVSEDFVLKIVDFGFATSIQGQDKKGILRQTLGTEGYMAPEIVLKNYRGDQVDLFACAVILFVMYAGHPPFPRALATDSYYRLLKEKKYNEFWEIHQKNKPQGFFSQNFRDLFQKMTCSNPQQRLKVEDIIAHPWWNGQKPDPCEVKSKLQERRMKVQEEKEKAKKEREQKRQRRLQMVQKYHKPEASTTTSIESKNSSSSNISTESETILISLVNQIFVKSYASEKNVGRNLPVCIRPCVNDYVLKEEVAFFFSTLYSFLDELKEVFRLGQSHSYEFKLKEYKAEQNQVLIVFQYYTAEVEHLVNVLLEIFDGGQGKLVLKFSRKRGHFMFYKQIVNLIKQQFVYCHCKKEKSKLKIAKKVSK